MFEVKMKLKSRIHWAHNPLPKEVYEEDDLEKYHELINTNNEKMLIFQINEKLTIKINANNCIVFAYINPVSKAVWYSDAIILLYFISLCTGDECSYDAVAEVNLMPIQTFDFPISDKSEFITHQKLKNADIFLIDILDEFGIIMNKILSSDKENMMFILCLYYLTLFHKDYPGNGMTQFKNKAMMIESIMILINKEKYETYRLNCKKAICKNCKKVAIPKSVPLEEKIIDAIKLCGEILGLNIIKINTNEFAKKVANTRNLYSHDGTKIIGKEYFENTAVMSNAGIILRHLFKILFFHHFGLSNKKIVKAFLTNSFYINNLSNIFVINAEVLKEKLLTDK